MCLNVITEPQPYMDISWWTLRGTKPTAVLLQPLGPKSVKNLKPITDEVLLNPLYTARAPTR